MIWRAKEKKRKVSKYIHNFDPWFAWYPVKLTDGTDRKVWLQIVECYQKIDSYESHTLFGAPFRVYESRFYYRLPKGAY